MTRREPNLVLWFFWCGVAGLLVASPFALLRLSHIFWGMDLQLVLWPASIFWIGSPSGIGGWVLMLALTFGSNFLLYGLVGTIVRFIVSLAENFFGPHSV